MPKYLRIGGYYHLVLPYFNRTVMVVGYDTTYDYVIYQDENERQHWLPECLFVLGVM